MILPSGRTRHHLPVFVLFISIFCPGLMGVDDMSGLTNVNCSGSVVPVPVGCGQYMWLVLLSTRHVPGAPTL